MRFRLTLTAAITAVALAGCGTSNEAAPVGTADLGTSTTTSSKPDKSEVVAWVDKVCGVAVDSLAPMQQQPTLDQNNLTKMKAQFIDYLTASSQSLGKGQTDLAALKDGPSKDSGTYVTSLSETIGKIKATMDTSIEKVQAANPKKPQEFGLAIQGVGMDIRTAGIVSSAGMGVLVEKDLADAEKQAPKCQKLKA